jgi:hypothetical protein
MVEFSVNMLLHCFLAWGFIGFMMEGWFGDILFPLRSMMASVEV